MKPYLRETASVRALAVTSICVWFLLCTFGGLRHAAADAAAGAVTRPGLLVAAGVGSTSTTTTVAPPPPTTTLDLGVNVTGGGRFHAGFTTGSHDLFFFELTGPAVLVAVTSDGKDLCNGDTTMELSLDGTILASDDDSGPGQCSKIELRLEDLVTYDITVTGYQGVAVPNYYLDVQFVATTCGNNIVELLEECDDGNVADGDCCSSLCSKNLDGTPCDNGLLCDGDDSCSHGACTQHSLTPCPGADGDASCAESCSDTVPGCTSPDPAGSECNDGLFCNGADRCHQGSCSVHAGNPCRGSDGDGHCSESCSESSDSCTAFDPNGTVCDDTNFCNGSDTCSSGSCGLHSGNPCPGPDGDADCAESCHESSETCTARDPNGSACDDGLFCTGADSCSAAACSVHAGNDCSGPDGDSNCAESCNEAAKTCSAADPAGTPCNDGVFCNGSDTCLNGACSVHTGSPCAGADGDGNCSESCDETLDLCTAPDPNGSACSDGVFCNGADTCSGGACSVHAGNPCAGADGDGNCAESCSESSDNCTAADPKGAVCNDGLYCNGADTCTNGACSTHSGSPCPGPDGDGNCAESCNEANDSCTANDPNGSACNDGLFCNGTDSCAAAACTVHAGSPCPGADGDSNCAESCNETNDSCTASDPGGSACNDGVFCNGADNCSDGSCAVHAGDPCPGVDGDGNCAESCNEVTDACSAADPNGSPCTDGMFCNGSDTCSGGGCSTHAGGPCVGPDGDGNCSESCNEAGDSCNGPDPNGSACTDGLFCNGSDTCSGGACSAHAGTPCPGPDGDGNCAESCNESGDVCTAPDPNGSYCSDGTFCNGADTCAGGSCGVHAGDPCPGADGDGNCAESCNEQADACSAADSDGTPCNDGLFCNGADTCAGGTCGVHAGSPCPGADGDEDCTETCSEAADACTGADPGGSACDDGLFCNGADTCSDGTCSVHSGNPCTGADGDGNCSESCNEDADNCAGADLNGSPCSDGLVCNGTDTCAVGFCVQHSGNPCAGADGDGDCSESCSDQAAGCTAPDPNGSPCDDGIFCNGPDRCSGGTCSEHAGDPCPGADGDGNCAESCNEAADACNAPDGDGAACDDGLFCNGADTCASGACGVHAGNPCPGADGDGNCSETCNEAGDACNAADPAGSACDDGLFCNGADTCSGGSCSAHGGSPCPGPDADGNCAESCNEAGDACNGADPVGSTCTDGLFCNGNDACSGGACSQHAGDPCSGADGDGNCAESCDELADACTAADSNGTSCDDGLFCNGADTCSAGVCNQHAGPPCPGADGDGSCAESCSEQADSCSASDPDGSACNDGVFCNGTDTCSSGSCNQHAGSSCAGADGDGNCAESCDETAGACSAFDPDGAACSDGNPCTSDDSCDGAGACSGGAALDCVDDDECTEDACNTTGPLCTHSPIDNCPPTTTTTLVSIVCGDVNEDDSVSAGDALAVLQSAVGGAKCDGRACVCDVNANDAVTAADALLVLRSAVGLPVTLTCTC